MPRIFPAIIILALFAVAALAVACDPFKAFENYGQAPQQEQPS